MPKRKIAVLCTAVLAMLVMIAVLIATGDRYQMKKNREQALSQEADTGARTEQTEESGNTKEEAARENAQAQLPAFCVERLRIGGADAPCGLDESGLSFSWELAAAKGSEPASSEDLTQKAWQIQVREAAASGSDANSPALEGSAEKKLVWDSGIIKGSETKDIAYYGKPLSGFTRYEWQVFSYDEKNRCAVSAPQPFTTGYFGSEPFAEASFITMTEEENVYYEGMPVYRKDFTLSGQIETAFLCISALGQYEAFLNGEAVEESACFAPGWTDYHDRLLYRVIDVTDYLSEGKNRLAAQVGTGWWAGRNAFGTYDYKRPALIAQLQIRYTDGRQETLSTDESWQYVKDTAIRDADYFNGETFDAGCPDAAALSLAEDATDGKPVCESTDFGGEFTVYTGPEVGFVTALDQLPVSAAVYEGTEDNGSDFGKLKLVSRPDIAGGKGDPAAEETAVFSASPVALAKGQVLIADLGQNMTGVPGIRVSGPAGSQVTIQFAEMCNDTGEKDKGNDGPAGSLYRANYRSAETTVRLILPQGNDASQPVAYHPTLFYTGFRYLSVEADADVTVYDLRGLYIGNTSEETGSLVTDNADVNRLFENVLWSQRNNFFLVATDCPQRDERLGWTGDLNSFAATSMYNADLRSFYDKWALDLADAQTAEGAIPDTIPTTIHTGAGNGGWGDCGILIPLNVYRKYGNPDYLEALYPVMERYMEYLSGQSNFDTGSGRIGPAPTYGDWLAAEQTDSDFLCAMWYGADADAMRKICRILGKTEEEKSYEALFEKIRGFLYDRYIAKKKSLTQTETLFLLHYDLLQPDNAGGLTRDALFASLCSAVEENGYKLATGFAGTPLLLPELCSGGREDLAYRVLLCRDNPSWLYSIDQGATTIWERYDSYTKERGFADAAMNSFDHFNEGSVAQWMYEQMAGICVDHTMEVPIRICPALPPAEIPLKKVSSSYHSVYGTISVEWQLSNEDGKDAKASCKVVIPANTKAVIELPFEGFAKQTVGGGSYSFEGKPAE